MLDMETRILVARMVPGFDDGVLKQIFGSRTVKAVVLELYGTGTAPSRHAGLIEALEIAVAHDVVVVATTQCRRGGIEMGVYEVGEALGRCGVISCADMTAECAATKLAYLFGRLGDDAAAVRRLVAVSLRGELSPPAQYLRPFFDDCCARAAVCLLYTSPSPRD